jgi:molybdenum cofactor synthesis domain-containing protein
MPNPTAAMLVIGDEVLSGRTHDSNTRHLASVLTDMGVALREARVCPDETGEIVRHVNALRAAYDHVFTSGGIGPTHDDITADSVAKPPSASPSACATTPARSWRRITPSAS